MKKIITVAAVIVTACLNLAAQTCVPTSAVTDSFGREFKTATNIYWTRIKSKTPFIMSDQGSAVFLSRFDNEGEHCLAYFGGAGELILSGRRIDFEVAPKAVQKAADRVKIKSETKGERMAVADVYELTDAGGTRYFINMNSETVSLSILAYGNGQSEILKKAINTKDILFPGPELASK